MSIPAIGNDVVVVQTIDGFLRGLSAFDGSILWAIEHAAPALTLRGSAAPVIAGTTVIAGFDNGRLIAASLLDGATEWEAMLSPPSGRSDLDRLADVDGRVTVVGQEFMLPVIRAASQRSRPNPGRFCGPVSCRPTLASARRWDKVYALTAEGELVAMQRRNGDDSWRQTALIRREPSTPVPFNTSVVVGDFEGYLHFFDTATGATVARERVARGLSPVSRS